MHQTLGQRRNNWRRAACDRSPDGRHFPIECEDTCVFCGEKVMFGSIHPNMNKDQICYWMTASHVTIVEWL